jgi:hypothetical protein
MKSLIIVLAIFALSGRIKAQTNCACCDETHKQFDFWVGEWIVMDSLGNKVGENQISKIEENCIVLEHWTGAKGGTGTSHNYYDKTDSTWNQLWVDNKGNVLKLKGRFESGRMVLKSDPDTLGVKGKKNESTYNQITWTQNEDGTVSQLWEKYDQNDKLIKTVFLGIYHRKE